MRRYVRRSRSISYRKRLTSEERSELRDLEVEVAGIERPRTRAECVDGVRPCPFVSCRFSLYLEVEDTGTIKLNHPDLEPDQMPDSCALDVSDRGGSTLDEVGRLLNVTRERTRQIEIKAGNNFRSSARRLFPEAAALVTEGMLFEGSGRLGDE